MGKSEARVPSLPDWLHLLVKVCWRTFVLEKKVEIAGSSKGKSAG